MSQSDTPALPALPTFDNSALLAAMEQIHASMQKARASMAQFGEVAASVRASLAGFGEDLAKTGIKDFTEGIKNAMEQGRQFAEQARQTGQSVATMVELQKAFAAAGVSGDNVTGALFSLNKALGDASAGGKPAADVFTQLGLSVDKLKGMSGVGQFQAIIQGLQGIPDAAGRAAAAQQIFGERARDMMGVLNDPKGFDAAVAGSATLAGAMQDGAGSFQKVGEAAAQVQETIQAFFAEVAGGVAPALANIFDLVKKINLPQFGADLGRGISFAFEAFKEGKAFEMLRLSLTIAFKEAVNSLYRGIVAIGAASGVVFSELPKLLSDAFSMLTTPKYWEGVGKLALGSFQGIQGELTKIFFGLADAFGNRIADIMAGIPMLKDIAEKIRTEMNNGNKVLQSALDKARAQSTQLSNEGSAEVKDASATVGNDIAGTAQAAGAAAQAAEQKTGPVLSSDQEQASLKAINRGLVTNILQTQQADNSGNMPPSQTNGTMPSITPSSTTKTNKDKRLAEKINPFANFKVPEADRFAKLGLFMGGAPVIQMPGLSEARRTAKATEESRVLLKQVLIKLDSLKSSSVATYG